MKLQQFSVAKYRSITDAHEIPIKDMTVLVGKNNEGKSNILCALEMAMKIMELYAYDSRRLQAPMLLKQYYDWEHDYPLQLQEKCPKDSSRVDLTFKLTNDEVNDIKTNTGANLNGNLTIRVLASKTGAKISISKRGTAAFSDQQKKEYVINYVCKKIDFNFIPAIRTEEDSIKVIRSLIEKHLFTLENEKEYTDAVAIIENLRQKKLNDIAEEVAGQLQAFLPDVKSVRISPQEYPQGYRRRADLRQNVQVIVDDGTPTPIQFKGDGIKSITAIAMLNMSHSDNRVSVIAIEEPESHLHPGSARQLFQTISTLSENHQVILTTHSPIFVNRDNLKENIIVDKGKATPAGKIKEIRDVLGTHISDNLVSAENILLVEGLSDKCSLEAILPALSVPIKSALQNGTLVIDHLGGSANLTYKLQLYMGLQCRCYALMDDDVAGRNADKAAREAGLLTSKDITLTHCACFNEAELEDLYDVKLYAPVVNEQFGVDLSTAPSFKGNKYKWSCRVEKSFRNQGKPWDSTIEMQIKTAVSKAVIAHPESAFEVHKREPINGFVKSLEQMVTHKN